MDRRPNILIIMTDQHSPVLRGPDQPWGVRTPNIDAIAAEGLEFENAYCASPICVPSRCSFMTGLYPHQHRTFDNGASLAHDIPTFAHALTAVGYETVLCARMHFNGKEVHHGFEKRLVTDLNNPIEYQVPPVAPDVLADPKYDGRRPDFPDDGSYAVKDSPILQYDDYACKKACEYLRSKPGRERPFLLVTSFYGPHPMVAGREEYRELFHEYFARDLGAKELSEGEFNQLPAFVRRFLSNGTDRGKTISKAKIHRFRAEYFSRVTYTDSLIGKLMGTLSEEQLKEDTIVIYLSDHGEQMGDHGIFGKSVFFEYTCRVPLIISMQDRRVGKVRQNVSLIDLFPTLCDMAGGVEIEHDLPGRSLLPLMSGGVEQDEAVVLSEFMDWKGLRPAYMVKRGPWKYCFYTGEPEFLYNLDEDPGEWKNYARDPACVGILNELREELYRRVDPEAVEAQVRENRARRRLIFRATEAGPQTQARLRAYVRDFRKKWDEPFWDDNDLQSSFESHLHWDEETTRLGS